ncbi:MAG: BTAD domain-containing putative transcriptional regulator [Kineosporiaceae bacterium]
MAADGTRPVRLDVRLLGPVEAVVDGRAVLVRRGRQQLLLAALALRPGEAVPAFRLVDELWPDGLPEGPENALQQLVSAVRRCLGPARTLLATVPSGYRLDITAEDTDAGRAAAAATRGAALLAAGSVAVARGVLEGALATWRGEPLGGVRNGPLHDEAERLHALRGRLEIAAADCALVARDPPALEAAAHRLATATSHRPLDEPLWERRIAVLTAVGRPAEALTVYETVRRTLADELGVDPSPELRSWHARLVAGGPVEPGSAADRRDDARPVASSVGSVHLPPLPPLPPSRLVGRAAELDQLSRWRAEGVRLVTVVGPAGIGKTRLAMEDVHRVDGPVAVVLLDTLAPDSDVSAAVAAAARLHEVGTRDITDVLAQSLPVGTTLVLDNAEHVLGRVATFVGELLARSPDLTVLVTSQWPLGLVGEHQLRLEPLPGAAQDLGAELLLDRAAQVRPALATPSDDDTAAAAQIAALLDGVPLAIELAAAQARHLSLPQLAASLAGSLDLLDRDTLRVAARHRRLVDAVDWSLGLLAPEHLDVFTRCAVLAGVFDTDLAAAVTGLSPAASLSSLLDLADRSMVHVVIADPVRPGGPRFCLLRPLRVHAARCLGRSGQTAPTRDRLLDWAVDLTARADDGIRGPDQLTWLARLDAARGDIENALAHAVGSGRLDDAARVVAALGRYWDWRGRLRDTERWTAAVMAAATGPTLARYGSVAAWRGFVAIERGDPDTGARWAEAGLEAARRAGDRDSETTCLAILSLVPEEGTRRALDTLDTGLRLAQHSQDRWACAWGVNRRGYVRLLTGDLDAAAADADTSRADFEALGDRRAVHWADHLTALVAHRRGDVDRAAVMSAATLSAAQDVGDLRTAGQAAELLAVVVADAEERESLRRLSRTFRADRTDGTV